MLADIEALHFFVLCNTKTYCLFDDCEYDNHANNCPSYDCNNTESLLTKLSKATTVEKTCDAVLTVTCCEKTYCKAAPHTVYAVYRECADRIIYFKLDINKFNCYYDEDT